MQNQTRSSALGVVLVHLTSPFWWSSVDEGIIIMPVDRLGDRNSILRNRKLLEQFAYALENCGGCGNYVSMKCLSARSKIVQF